MDLEAAIMTGKHAPRDLDFGHHRDELGLHENADNLAEGAEERISNVEKLQNNSMRTSHDDPMSLRPSGWSTKLAGKKGMLADKVWTEYQHQKQRDIDNLRALDRVH